MKRVFRWEYTLAGGTRLTGAYRPLFTIRAAKWGLFKEE